VPSGYDCRGLLAAACLIWSAAAAAQSGPAFFLVASPKITDPSFRETVVLVIQHTSLASRGVIINRPLDTPLSRLHPGDEAFARNKDPIYFGGPVALPSLSFVFHARERPQGSVHVTEDLYIGDSPSLLKDLLQQKGSAGGVRVYAGHAGWGPGQLQSEIEEGGWFATRASSEFVFHEHPESIWRELLRRASQRSAQTFVVPHTAAVRLADAPE
jgi:putative transcriptional regulator